MNTNQMLTYFSGSKNTPNRVTIVGQICDDSICLAFARQSDKDPFSGTEGIEYATRRLKANRNCISIPKNTDDILAYFKSIYNKISAQISPNINYKSDIKENKIILN